MTGARHNFLTEVTSQVTSLMPFGELKKYGKEDKERQCDRVPLSLCVFWARIFVIPAQYFQTTLWGLAGISSCSWGDVVRHAMIQRCPWVHLGMGGLPMAEGLGSPSSPSSFALPLL